MAKTISPIELAAVAAVGLGLGFALTKTPVVGAQLAKNPLVTGALLYTGGYLIAVQFRPESGWPQLKG
jgi:hypothetical protein